MAQMNFEHVALMLEFGKTNVKALCNVIVIPN